MYVQTVLRRKTKARSSIESVERNFRANGNNFIKRGNNEGEYDKLFRVCYCTKQRQNPGPCGWVGGKAKKQYIDHKI